MLARLASVALMALLLAPAARAQTPAFEVKDAANATLMRLNTDGGFYVRVPSFLGAIPVTGSGSRLMWYPAKSAFRAGHVEGAQWDAANVGDYSTAMGYRTTAQAYVSVVIGQYNTVPLLGGYNATAWEADDPLFVAGNGSGTSARSNALFLRKDGNLTIAGTLTQNSDARLKEDVRPLGGALARAMALRPVSYRFRAGTNRPGGVQIGLIAQEVRAVYPELVRAEADGYLSVAYANVSAVAVAAIQEQQAEIEALRAEVADLRAAFAALRAALASPAVIAPASSRR